MMKAVDAKDPTVRVFLASFGMIVAVALQQVTVISCLAGPRSTEAVQFKVPEFRASRCRVA